MQPRISLIRVPEGVSSGGNAEQEIFEQIMNENFPKPVEHSNPQIKEVKIIPSRKNKRNFGKPKTMKIFSKKLNKEDGPPL